MNKQIDELMALWRQIAEVLLKDPHNDKIRIAFISALESALGQSQAVPASALKPCELIGWEWRWYDANPNTVTHGQWSEWKRVEPRNLLQTVDDAVNEFRAYIANGQRYELRALYTAAPPQHKHQCKCLHLMNVVMQYLQQHHRHGCRMDGWTRKASDAWTQGW